MQLEPNWDKFVLLAIRNNIRLTLAGERLILGAESLMNTWLQAKKSHASQHSELSSIGALQHRSGIAYLTSWQEAY